MNMDYNFKRGRCETMENRIENYRKRLMKKADVFLF